MRTKLIKNDTNKSFSFPNNELKDFCSSHVGYNDLCFGMLKFLMIKKFKFLIFLRIKFK
jgi:hypothetical protein